MNAKQCINAEYMGSTMAEISEPLMASIDPPQQNPEAPTGHQGPASQDGLKDSLRETKPGLKRLFLTLSVLFSFLLGIPFFWKSTEIYRAPLPFLDIDSLSTQMESDPLQFPCHFQVIFVGFNSESSPDDLRLSVLNHMTRLTSRASQCGTCSSNYTVSVTIDSGSDCLQTQDGEPSCSYSCGGINGIGCDGGLEGDDEGVDELLRSILGDCSGSSSGGKVYSVVVVDRDEEVRAVVGKYRHAWIIGRVADADMVSRVAEIFVKVFVNGGKNEGLIHGEFMPVGADGRIVLSFNLLNSDPSDRIYDWDFQKVDETLLAPIVEALGPVANISVESQVLYHTPKSSFSSWDDGRNGYIFSTQDLPFFVNSNEWHLDTSIAAGGTSKILQFVVYIPSAKECPLLLQLPDGEISKTNGFVSPMWGGVIVWNPQGCSQSSENKHPVKHTISDQDLQNIFEVFMGQFRQLFGLKSDNLYVGTSGKYNLLASERGFTEWELDVLSRQHTCFNLRSCATTLGSLSRLVQSLPRMIIMDEIGKQVKFSLVAAELAQSNASEGVSDASAVSSREARSLAEDAFFHPSIMSVSYYSFEHCFAVYSPFFMPVSMHIILAALRELKRYKEEKAKYSAWKLKTAS